MDQRATAWAIGIEVSPARILGGVVDTATGVIVRRLEVTTPPGATQALEACAQVGRDLGSSHRVHGIGMACRYDMALVDVELAPAFGGATVHVLSHDRAAALGEARAGAGRGLDCFVYVSIDDAVAAVVVRHGVPWEGRSSALLSGGVEHWDSAPDDGFVGGGSRTATGVLTRPQRAATPMTTDMKLGAEIGWLIDLTDPDGIIVGGSLGRDAAYRRRWVDRMRRSVWDRPASLVPVVGAALGTDAPLVGAALAAAQGSNTLLRNR